MSPNVARQQGFLIPLALFILVGMAALSIAVVRMSASSNTQSFQELLSVQTFYAADSGAQLAMNQVLFPSATRSVGDAACTAMVGVTSTILSCSVTRSCSLAVDSTGTNSVYTIESTASCGAGDMASERTIRASAWLSD